MSEGTEETTIEETPETLTPDPESTEESKSEESGEETSQEGEGAEEKEVEVVIDDEGEKAQSSKTGKFRDRINRKNAEIADATTKLADKERELETYKKVFESYSKANQSPDPAGQQDLPPNPDDFNGGIYDLEFQQKQNEFVQRKNKEDLLEFFQNSGKQQAQVDKKRVDDERVVENRTKHYERASVLNVKDFAETEDKALAILGPTKADVIIQGTPANSELILYALGKNPSKAEYFNNLLDKDAVRALVEIGAFANKISVKPKINDASDPETELEGGGVSAQSLQEQYNRAKKVASSGDPAGMRKMLDLSKKAKEQNVKLE